ncbi:MAG: murein biosynthesis integral membrane protein MurJ [Chloroflexi bacterium]|nr:MAG: murein biosynthesis integral membrane protein MurJ [Chloroflexota bacterium]
MTAPNKNTNANRQIARAAGTVMFALLFGQLASLARSILVAGAFGASPELDAFTAANRVSETLFLLVAGGALGSAFIPVFTGLLTRNEKDPAWRLASALANAVTLTLSLLAVLMAIFAPQVVRYALAPGFAKNPEIFALAVSLTRIQLISAVLFGLGGLIGGILNARQVFFIPALTPAMYQLGIIFGAVVLAPVMGIYGLAWGVVLGALAYVLVQIPTLIKQKGNYSLTLGLENPDVRTVILLMGPRLLGVAVVQLNFWVNIQLASQMGAGSVASLGFAFSLMIMAQAAIAQSVAIAAMPTFSAQHALGKRDEMRSSLAASLRGILLMALPASVGLIMLREPLIAFLYQRGKFDAEDTQLAAWALLWYAAGLVGHSVMEVLTRAFYAQHDTKTPVIIGTIAMALNVVFSFTFARMFSQIGWMPHGGLALANSLATALEATALFIFMRRRLNGIEAKHIARGFIACALASLGMGVGLWLWLQAGGSLTRGSAVITLGGVLIGGIIYGIGIILLRVPEVQILMRAITRRLLQRASPPS